MIPCCEQVADHHQQHDVERLQRGELPAVDDPHQDDDQREQDQAAEDEIHQGSTVIVECWVSSVCGPSSSRSVSGRRQARLVGFTDHSNQTVSV